MGFQCRACSSRDLFEMIDLGNQPIAHRLLSSPDDLENQYPFVVYFCRSCGLMQICQPIDPRELYLDYNYCFSSWKEEPHAYDEIETIFSLIKPKSIFEIACNDGKFLGLLKDKGAPLLVGLEPNPFANQRARGKGFTVFSKMLNESICQDAVRQFGKFDLVVAREVLEHMTDIVNFFKCVDILLSDNGFLFLDTPDIETALVMGDCSVLWEEHPNYFTKAVITNILAHFGYEALSIKNYNFSGGVMGILARRLCGAPKAIAIGELEDKASAFSQKAHKYGKDLCLALSKYKKNGSRILLYGTGCRASTFVNAFHLERYIDFAIDDQQERQNKYMPASRLYIQAPGILSNSSSATLCLLAVNQENEAKVKQKLEDLKVKNIEFISLLSPNDIWQELKTANEYASL